MFYVTTSTSFVMRLPDNACSVEWGPDEITEPLSRYHPALLQCGSPFLRIQKRDMLGNVCTVIASRFSICEFSLTSSIVLSRQLVWLFRIAPVASELSEVNDLLHGLVYDWVVTSQGSPHAVSCEGCLASIWPGIFPRTFYGDEDFKSGLLGYDSV